MSPFCHPIWVALEIKENKACWIFFYSTIKQHDEH